MDWLPPQFEPDLVSIVIVTHCRAQLLAETMQSVLSQTYRPLEVILVSDGDDAATSKVAENLSPPDGMTIEYQVQPPSGACQARNRGARLTHGEYLVFMDDDDLAASDFIASRIRVARSSQPKALLVYGPYLEFYQAAEGYYVKEPAWRQPAADDATPWRSFLMGWNLLLQGCLLHRSLVNQVGPWDESLAKSQDFDYKVRLLHTDCPVAMSEAGRVYYRRHRQAISRTDTAHHAESIMVAMRKCRQFAERRSDYEQVKAGLADRFWHFGTALLRRAHGADASQMFREALEIDSGVLKRQRPLVRYLYRMGAIGLWGQYLYWQRGRGRLAIESSQNGPRQQLPVS